jgi:uncharacterized protein (DUF2336 family)
LVDDGRVSLSVADVERLLKDPSAQNRAETAGKVGNAFSGAALSPDERQIAEEILRTMTRDAEVIVRAALSDSVKENPDVPRDIALSLASDVVEVAAPVLEFSKVLSDADLLEIIQNKPPPGHQMAVARRETVSESISDALVGTDHEDVVVELVKNEGAQISESTMNKVVEGFSGSERVNATLVRRKSLPLTVSERLVNLVSDTLREHLITHHELSPTVATDVLMQTRERATVGLVKPGVDVLDLEDLVDQLDQNGRLTPTLMLRALCMGDTGFFEAALARRAGISVVNAYTLIHDPGKQGFSALYHNCELPDEMYPVFRAAVDVSEETHYDGGDDDQSRYRQRMIERILTQFEDGFDSEDLDFFIDRLGRKTAAAS